jgi:hypothetical protein
MPETAIDTMDEACRTAYEDWADEARETGKTTYG